MRKFLTCVFATLLSPAVFAQASVTAHININQPGIYGRIDIGELPSVAIVQPQPIIVAPAPVYVEQPPVYLYVPPAHQQNWRRYCGQYHACGQRVYFVRDEWVRQRYEEEHPDWEHGKKHNHGHDKKDKDDKHDNGKHRGHGGDD
jgi:hypothetical protein